MAETNPTPDGSDASLPADRAVAARAVGGDESSAGRPSDEVRPDEVRTDGVRPDGDRSVDDRPVDDRPAEPGDDGVRAAAAEPERRVAATAVPATDTTPAPPAAPAGQPVLAPAQDRPEPPKRRSNRLVGTMWVLLAAGLFEVVYIALVALVVLLLGGAAAVGPETAVIVSSPFGWLPVIFFFLLFELTVLLLNRAGRFTYVVASAIVGLLVYVVSVLLVSVIVRGGLGDSSTLAQTFLLPWSLLTGIVAREVMLWTGFAIGARGKRLRRRNRAAQQAYDAEVAEPRDAAPIA